MESNSNGSNAAAIVERETPEQSWWSQNADLILLESLQKFQNCGRLDIAHFVVERLFRQDSFSRAMRMTAGNTHLRAFTRSIMNDKFPPLQEEHVAEVATPSVGRTRSLRGDSTAPISVQGYPVSSQSDELNRQEFFYESPIFDSGTVLESVKLFRVCHEQDMEIVQLLGEMLDDRREDGELMYLVERLCLPTSIDVALAFFDAAKNEALSAFTTKVKVRRFRPTEVATVMVSGSESSPFSLVDTTQPIDEEWARRRQEWSENANLTLRQALAARGPPWQQNGVDNEDESEESVDEETAVPRP